MHADRLSPVDPARDRISQQMLLELGGQRWVWYLRVHHLAADGYGMALFTDRVCALYAGRMGEPLPGLAGVLADDAAYRADPRRTQAGQWWREQMQGAPAGGGLAGTLAASDDALRWVQPLDAAFREQLLQASVRWLQPWPDVLAALSAEYLRRMSAADEVVLGVPYMGRLGNASARVPAMVSECVAAARGGRRGAAWRPSPAAWACMIALVAVLRAGAAYLPLDLAHPDERLARILASAQPVCVLAAAEDSARMAGVPVLAPEQWTALSFAAPWADPAPSDAAYVIYTSGSTGEPKGVVIEHRAIVNRLLWMREHYGIRADDRVLQKTPATFDVSVWEFFLPLLCGATLMVAGPDAHRDPTELARLIREHGITTAHSCHRCWMPSSLHRPPKGCSCDGCSPVARRWMLRPATASTRVCTPSCTTCMARPKLRWTSATGRRRRRIVRGRCRSGSRSGTPACTCWTPGCSRCRWAWPVTCTWVVCNWHAAISVAMT